MHPRNIIWYKKTKVLFMWKLCMWYVSEKIRKKTKTNNYFLVGVYIPSPGCISLSGDPRLPLRLLFQVPS